LIEKLYVNVAGLIRTAALCRKPDQKEFADLLSNLQKDIEAINNIRDSNGKERDWTNHLSMVADGASASAWVAVVSNPLAISSFNGRPFSHIVTGKQAWSVHRRDTRSEPILWSPCY
jgi:hypothetical protein